MPGWPPPNARSSQVLEALGSTCALAAQPLLVEGLSEVPLFFPALWLTVSSHPDISTLGPLERALQFSLLAWTLGCWWAAGGWIAASTTSTGHWDRGRSPPRMCQMRHGEAGEMQPGDPGALCYSSIPCLPLPGAGRFSVWAASGNKEVWEAAPCCMKSYFLYSYMGPQLSLWTPRSKAHFPAFQMCQWSRFPL